MADDDHETDDEETEAPSFKERLEEAREREGEEGHPGASPFEGGGGGGMGGNPFAQMMGGMMGGGPGGPGGRMQEEARDTAVARELSQLREQVETLNDNLERIADALED